VAPPIRTGWPAGPRHPSPKKSPTPSVTRHGLRQHRQFDAARLNVEDTLAGVPLREDGLSRLYSATVFAIPDESRNACACHGTRPSNARVHKRTTGALIGDGSHRRMVSLSNPRGGAPGQGGIIAGRSHPVRRDRPRRDSAGIRRVGGTVMDIEPEIEGIDDRALADAIRRRVRVVRQQFTWRLANDDCAVGNA